MNPKYKSKRWDIDKKSLTDKMNSIINKSKKLKDVLLKMNLNVKSNRKKFISLLANDITIHSSFNSVCKFINMISSDNSIKKCCENIIKKITIYTMESDTREDLYNKIMQFYLIEDNTGSVYNKFINKLLYHYTKNGLKLEQDNKTIFNNLTSKIKVIENKIRANINSWDNMLILSKNNLKGIPKKEINKLTTNDNKCKINLTENIYFYLMKNIDDVNVRKDIYIKYNTQCPKNINLLTELFILRNKVSKILSYDNYSDFKLQTQMARTSKTVQNFLRDISGTIDESFDKEMKTLLKLKKKYNNNDKNNEEINKLFAWDIEYYFNKWKLEYNLNDENIREYFPHTHVFDTVFRLYEELFGITIKKINDDHIWANDVFYYAVYDNIDGNDELVGYFYFDPFDRNGKPRQISCTCLQSACESPTQPGKKQKAIVVLVTFFQKQHKDIALLNHTDIITLVHELCHVFQNIFGYSKFSVFSGVNVESDYVQAPALIVEKLCWEKKIIKKLSQHYKTGKTLPNEIVDKIIKIRNIRIGYFYKQHIILSLYDQLVHSNSKFIELCEESITKSKKYNRDTMTATYNKLFSKIFMFRNLNNDITTIYLDKNTLDHRIWSNIANNFAAQNYGFLWSDVHATDIYCDKFNKNGNSIEFRNKMLSHGGSKDAIVQISNYLGRKSNSDNFLKYHSFISNEPEYSFFFKSESMSNKQILNDTDKYTNNDYDDDNFTSIETSICTDVINIDEIEDSELDTYEETIYSDINKFTEINDTIINTDNSTLHNLTCDDSDAYKTHHMSVGYNDIFAKVQPKK